MRFTNTRTKLSLVFVLGILLFSYGAFTAFATPPTSQYSPGATLDPSCVPGTTNCTVKILYDLYDENFTGTYAIAAPSATGDNSVAIGDGADASGDNAFAFGAAAFATGNTSLAIGGLVQASGTSSVALGHGLTASGDFSLALGYNTTASGDYSQAFGFGTEAGSYAETALGVLPTSYTPDSTIAFDINDRLFSLGNGTGPGFEHNALTIIKDGTFIINDDNTTWTSGVENKLFFDVTNQAFRAGSVDGTEWEGANVGDRSVALGFADTGFGLAAPIASGDDSFAVGVGTTASGTGSSVFGVGNVASGGGSVAFGQFTTASQDLSAAFGDGTTASGNASVAFGGVTIASGDTSAAFGASTIASGPTSVAFGNTTEASGVNSAVFGMGNEAFSLAETVFGHYATTYTPAGAANLELTDRLFAIGNGDNDPTDSTAMGVWPDTNNALTILKDGTFIVNDDSTSNGGSEEVKMFLNTDPAVQAFRVGAVDDNAWDPSNVGVKSIAMGFSYLGDPAPKASGDSSIAIGVGTQATAPYAVAIGSASLATNNFSFATGGNTTASGYYSFSANRATHAFSWAETALGMYNTDYTPDNAGGLDTDDRLFVIGNGSGAGAAASDAFTILKNGKVGVAIDNFEAVDGSAASPCDTSLLQVGDGDSGAAIGCVNMSSGDWAIASDYRLKENVSDLHYGLDTVLALQPKEYDYIRNGEHAVGFIAQDVKPLVPEVVIGNDYLGLSYASFVPILTKAIQELNDKINLISAGTTTGGQFGQLVVDTLFAHTICLDDVCIDRNSLQEILDATGVDAAPVPDSQGQSDPSGDVSADPGSGETPENPAASDVPTADPQGQPDPGTDPVLDPVI